MYPFGDLPGNLAAFCGVLRREHAFQVGPGEIHDAARALEVVDIADRARVTHAWRAILSSSRDTAAAFDEAFDAFFFPGPPGVPQAGLPAMEARGPRPARDETLAERPPASGEPGAAGEPDEGAGAMAAPIEIGDEPEPGDTRPARRALARYSPLDAEGVEAVDIRPVSPAWQGAARALMRRLHLGLSRRWRPASRGRRFDLRRTWRASLQTGGEAVTARWLRRIHRSPRLVLLIDGSRSMSGAHRAALDLAVALASATRQLEVFVFSTKLTSITSQARRAGAGRTTRVTLGREAWGGGTSIGASLKAFLRLHGERHVSRETLVVVVSDGLDVGDLESLRGAMREIHRRAAGVAWLNPLLETAGYEPTSGGMATARPFVTTFTSVSDAAALAQLARTVRLR